MSYILNQDYWGKGYMTEAVNTAIRICRERLGVERVYAFFSENRSSEKVMRRCGMWESPEGNYNCIIRGKNCEIVRYMIGRGDRQRMNGKNSGKGIVIITAALILGFTIGGGATALYYNYSGQETEITQETADIETGKVLLWGNEYSVEGVKLVTDGINVFSGEPIYALSGPREFTLSTEAVPQGVYLEEGEQDTGYWLTEFEGVQYAVPARNSDAGEKLLNYQKALEEVWAREEFQDRLDAYRVFLEERGLESSEDILFCSEAGKAFLETLLRTNWMSRPEISKAASQYYKTIQSYPEVALAEISAVGILSGSQPYEYVYSEEGIRELAYLQKVNKEVHELMSFGTGPAGEDESTIEKIMERGEGHCGHFSRIFSYLTRSENYEIRGASFLSSYNGGGHAMVEVKVSNKWYLFDPTNGIFYWTDLAGLVDNDHFYELQSGPAESVYAKEEIFAHITDVVYDYLEYTAFRQVGVSVFEQCRDYTLKYHTATPNEADPEIFISAQPRNYSTEKYYQLPQSLEIEFASEVEFNTICFGWDNRYSLGKNMTVEIYDADTEQYVEKISIEESDGLKEAYVLKDNIRTHKIRIKINEAYAPWQFLFPNIQIYKD